MLKRLVRLLLLITVVSSTQVMGHEGDKPKNTANTSGNAAVNNEIKNVGPTSQAEALRMQKAMNKALSMQSNLSGRVPLLSIGLSYTGDSAGTEEPNWGVIFEGRPNE